VNRDYRLDEKGEEFMPQLELDNFYSPRFFKELDIDFDHMNGVLWLYMKPHDKGCITTGLLRELRRYQQGLKKWEGKYLCGNSLYPVQYQIITSATEDIFNFGGDLGLFLNAIKDNDSDTLLNYAISCIDVVFNNATSYNLPITTISLVSGDALGGGLEGALSSSVVIAERGVQMGFPEVMFNLFPGMGAYNLLSERVPPSQAREIITSGKVFSSEEFCEMGIVDLLADKGKGVDVVNSYINKHRRSRHGRCAFEAAIQQVRPLSYDALYRMVKIWVETAMSLTTKDLRVMERIARAQVRKNAERISQICDLQNNYSI
jgi:DSF synthase